MLVHCQAGCEQANVIDALRARGIWPEREQSKDSLPTRTMMNAGIICSPSIASIGQAGNGSGRHSQTGLERLIRILGPSSDSPQ